MTGGLPAPRVLARAWLALGLLGLVATPQGGSSAPRVEALAIPRRDTPTAQLAYARALKGARLAQEPERREELTRRAVAAYRAVRRHHPRARSIGAEAAFRAGRLLAEAGDVAAALRELDVAAELGERTEFRARARLEAGHLHRREGRVSRALDAYLAVASDARAARDFRDEAWLRAGDVWRARGALDDARRAWRRVAADAADGRDRVLAYDRLGMAWLESGDVEAAAGVLHECLSTLKDAIEERTEQGERIRRTVRSMRLVAALPRRIEARWEESAKRPRTE